ncbi:GIY-YIG nuclease family protein [Candidatus Omnitrophota bacterium]
MSVDVVLTLKEFENRLIKESKHTPFGALWNKDFPDEGAVYVIWENNTPVYVGETSGLKRRMSELARPINHAFTKKMQKRFGLLDKDIKLLRKKISENFKVSFVVVSFGRAEIEEYLILRWRSTLINKITKRLLYGNQYKWVMPD